MFFRKLTTQSVARSATLLSMLTVFIKAIGFIKQSVISYYFGATAAMDSYLIVTDFISEVGTMFFSAAAITFISIYDEEKNQDERKNVFVSNAFLGLIVLSIILASLISLFAQPLTRLLAPGFTDILIKETARRLRFYAYLLINICFSNICIGLLNAEKKFAIAKSIGLIQSVCIIVACVLLEKTLGIRALFLGFTAFYLIENAFLLVNVRHLFSFTPQHPLKDARVRKMIRLTIPLFLSYSIIQINAMVDKAIASGLEEGSVSGMAYGSFIFSTIHSIIIGSTTTVLYSYFSEYVASNDLIGMIQKTNTGLQILVALLIPISLICFLNSKDIIRLIYGRGSFDESAITLSSEALWGYSFGFVFIAIRDIYQQVLYAFQKTTTVMLNGLIGVVINIALSIVLSKHIGILGIAIADSVAYCILALISFISTRHILPDIKETFQKSRFVVVGFSAAFTFIIALAINKTLIHIPFFVRLVMSASSIFVLYYSLMVCFKHESATYIKNILSKERKG